MDGRNSRHAWYDPQRLAMMRQPPGHTKRPTGSAAERGVMAKICVSIAWVVVTMVLIRTEPSIMTRVRSCHQ